MEIGPLALFAHTNSPRSFNLASWHSPHSLTWSWIVAVSFDAAWRTPRGGLRFGFSRLRHNTGGQAYLCLPFVVFHYSRQREMWFRDLHRKADARADALEREVAKLRRNVTLARATALVPDDMRPH